MSDSKAFFSVVIPVYNKAPFLDRSINSVINQSFTEFELLLIDDASTDGSLVEIQKFGDRRIRVLHRNCSGGRGLCGAESWSHGGQGGLGCVLGRGR